MKSNMYLEIKNLKKNFGDVVALNDISMKFERESLNVLLGPSGCGKTTLLRLLAGFEEPDEGDILINGSSIVRQSPEVRRIGIVFQDYALFPHMSVEKNISYGLIFDKNSSRKDKAARVQDLLSLFGIQDLKHRLPEELSAGQQQRVALARSLAPRPNVLLLDEPFSALDEQLRVRLRFELRQVLSEVGVTTIHVTHDQEEALAIADRVVVMREGLIEQVGSPEEIYTDPETPFVAEFVGRGNVLDALFVSSYGGLSQVELADGQRVRVMNSQDLSLEPGDPLVLLIRPEHLMWEGHADNLLRGVLKGIEYLGDTMLAYVSIADQTCVVKLPGFSNEFGSIRKDQGVTLTFRPEDAKIYICK